MNNLIAISGKQGSGKDTVGKIIQYLDWKESIEKGNSKSLHYTIDDFLKGDISFVTDWKIKKFGKKVKEIVALLIGCPVLKLEDREFKEKPLGEEWHVWFTHYAREEQSKLFNDKISRDNYMSKLRKGDYGTYEDTVTGDYRLTPRKLMQLVGTEAGRDIIHPDLWVNALFADYKWHTYRSPTYNDVKKSFIYPKWIITDLRFPNELRAIKNRGGIVIRINRPLTTSIEYKDGSEDETVAAPNFELSNHPSETALDDYKKWDYVIDNNGSIDDLVIKVKEIYEDIKTQ